MHGKAGIRRCNLTWQLRISSTQLVEYLASPSYVQRSPSIRGARHILLVRVRNSGTVEVSPSSSISTDPCKTLLSHAFASMVAANGTNVVSKKPFYVLLSLCSVFSEDEALGEDENGILVWKSVLVRILAKRGCGEYTDDSTFPVCLGRASSGASSDAGELAGWARVRLFVAPPVANRRTPLPHPPGRAPVPPGRIRCKTNKPAVGRGYTSHPLC